MDVTLSQLNGFLHNVHYRRGWTPVRWSLLGYRWFVPKPCSATTRRSIWWISRRQKQRKKKRSRLCINGEQSSSSKVIAMVNLFRESLIFSLLLFSCFPSCFCNVHYDVLSINSLSGRGCSCCVLLLFNTLFHTFYLILIDVNLSIARLVSCNILAKYLHALDIMTSTKNWIAMLKIYNQTY